MRVAVVGDLHGRIGAARMVAKLIRSSKPSAVVLVGDIGPGLGEEDNASSESHGVRIADSQAVLDAFRTLACPVLFVPGNWDARGLAGEKAINIDVCAGYPVVKVDNACFLGIGGGCGEISAWPYHWPDEPHALGRARAGIVRCRDPLLFVVSHTPPRCLAIDAAPSTGAHYGSKALRGILETSRPSVVLSGHVHESPGVELIGRTVVINAGCADTRLTAVSIGSALAVLLGLTARFLILDMSDNGGCLAIREVYCGPRNAILAGLQTALRYSRTRGWLPPRRATGSGGLL